MMNERLNIVLTGPPGSGKTSVGRLLAKRAGRAFIDMDEELSHRFGSSLDVVFTSRGEAEFRKAESTLCQEFRAKTNLVIATGGGTLVNMANRENLEANGILVNLNASVDTLERRMRREGGRPLLAENSALQMKELLAARRKVYDSVGIQIDTEHKNPAEIVELVFEAVKNPKID